MRRIALISAAVVAAAVLGGGGVALALSRSSAPQTRQVTAEFSLNTPTVADHHECQGIDGLYDSYHYVYPGTETSAYGFLSGDVSFEEFGLTNVTSNVGYLSGTWTLTDPNTGQV